MFSLPPIKQTLIQYASNAECELLTLSYFIQLDYKFFRYIYRHVISDFFAHQNVHQKFYKIPLVRSLILSVRAPSIGEAQGRKFQGSASIKNFPRKGCAFVALFGWPTLASVEDKLAAPYRYQVDHNTLECNHTRGTRDNLCKLSSSQ